ncbi:MAG: sulfatase-like hydrolase/transferase [Clostridia bacterium]|nr:sulfatase-like hydrolase/transferase [Clostridia bacterium]
MKKKPNVLFILSDQHSPHVTGYEGNEIINTPNLDKLASEGAFFSNAYCQNPLCVPSRASILTGRYSKNTGIYDNMHVMDANGVTLPRIFSDNGYRTCLIGKSHFNGEQYHGYQQRPYGDLFGQAHQPDPKREPEFGINGLGDVLGNAGPSLIPVELTQTEICVKEACKWIQVHQELHSTQPFFLSVNFDKPHFPIKPPKKYFSKYENMSLLKKLPENFDREMVPFAKEAIMHNETGHHFNQHFDIQENALQAYYGCVEWIDDAIGRIVEVIDYLGLKEDTIIIYSSDHGEMGGEHGTWQKTLFYEASARVPFIIRWPGHIKVKSSYDQIIGLLDIFPSLCDLCQLTTPIECDGESIKNILEENGLFQREGIFAESAVLRATHIAGCMYRTGPWKYCHYLDGHHELFHLQDDPDEYHNLFEQYKDSNFLRDIQEKTIAFFDPENYLTRLRKTPIMSKEKHFYPYSNQFVLGDGIIADAKP